MLTIIELIHAKKETEAKKISHTPFVFFNFLGKTFIERSNFVSNLFIEDLIFDQNIFPTLL